MAIDGTAVCAGSWTSPCPGTLGAFRSEYSVVPQPRPSLLAGRTRYRAQHRRNQCGPVRGSYRRELPSLYLSANENQNRPGTSEIFCRWYSNAADRLNNLLPKQYHSWLEEIELLCCFVVRCSGNAAKSIQQALNAMPDRDHGMAVATREFQARDAFELELNQ